MAPLRLVIDVEERDVANPFPVAWYTHSGVTQCERAAESTVVWWSNKLNPYPCWWKAMYSWMVGDMVSSNS